MQSIVNLVIALRPPLGIQAVMNPFVSHQFYILERPADEVDLSLTDYLQNKVENLDIQER
jgi:hypothetical protein